jgi:hypothetical protein
MSYVSFNSLTTEFAVDWEIVRRLCLSYWLSKYQLENLDTSPLPDSDSLPAIKTVQVDWDKVRNDAWANCASDMFSYVKKAGTDMRGVAEDLKLKVIQTAVNRRDFTNTLRDIQSKNITEMERAVKHYSDIKDALSFLRDTTADIVAIGSTIATGGAAAALLGASSVLQGVYKYQDTGMAGSALLYGAGSMALGVFKVGGAKVKKGTEVALIIAKGFLEAGTSLAAGDKFAKVIEKGALKIASTGSVQALFSAEWVKTVFSKMPVPFTVWSKIIDDGVNVMYEDKASELVQKTAKKLVEKGAKKAITLAMNSSQTTKGDAFIDEATVEDLFLLYFAIVNMQKGIGRGW